MRRARAAALRPAATPPITTSAIGRLFLFPHLLDEIENVERLDFAVREEAVDGVLLVGEQVEHGGELGHYQQLDVPAIQVEQFHDSARLAQSGGTDHESAEPGAVDVIDIS